MRTRLTLRPGQNGTKSMVQKYGDKLLAVRYRYDTGAKKRIKTVELIEQVLPWKAPPAPPPPGPQDAVYLHVEYDEYELRRKIRAAGGAWSQERRMYRIAFGAVQSLGLEARLKANGACEPSSP